MQNMKLQDIQMTSDARL